MGGARGHQEDAPGGGADGVDQVLQVAGHPALLLPHHQVVVEGQVLAGAGLQAQEVGQQGALVGHRFGGGEGGPVGPDPGGQLLVHGVLAQAPEGRHQGGLVRGLVQGAHLGQQGLAQVQALLEGVEEPFGGRIREVVAEDPLQVLRGGGDLLVHEIPEGGPQARVPDVELGAPGARRGEGQGPRQGKDRVGPFREPEALPLGKGDEHARLAEHRGEVAGDHHELPEGVRAQARVERRAGLHGHHARHPGVAEGRGVRAFALGVGLAHGLHEAHGGLRHGAGAAGARPGQGFGVELLHHVGDHLPVVVGDHPVPALGEPGLQGVGVGDVPVVGAHHLDLAGHVVGLAVDVRDRAVGGPAHLADEALAHLPVHAQVHHHAAGRADLLEEADGAAGVHEGAAGGIIAAVLQALEELSALLAQAGVLGPIADGYDSTHVGSPSL